jgi:hypothetical protein
MSAEGAGGAAKDVRYEWLQSRVCSSLRVRDEAFQKLLQTEAKCVLCISLKVQGAWLLISMPEPHVQGCPCELPGRCRHQEALGVCGWQGAGRGKCRSVQLVAAATQGAHCWALPVYCLQTTKPPQKLKKKTVYFVKTAPQRIDNDNIRKTVRTSAAYPSGPSRRCTYHPCHIVGF